MSNISLIIIRIMAISAMLFSNLFDAIMPRIISIIVAMGNKTFSEYLNASFNFTKESAPIRTMLAMITEKHSTQLNIANDRNIKLVAITAINRIAPMIIIIFCMII